MVVLAKTVKRYCPKCKKHTEQKLKQAKRRGHNQAHPLTHGSRRRMRDRGLDRGAGNKGRTSRGAPGGWKLSNRKTSKKTDLRYTCSECGKTFVKKNTFRAKKLELK